MVHGSSRLAIPLSNSIEAVGQLSTMSLDAWGISKRIFLGPHGGLVIALRRKRLAKIRIETQGELEELRR
jgi:hypothetical protein